MKEKDKKSTYSIWKIDRTWVENRYRDHLSRLWSSKRWT